MSPKVYITLFLMMGHPAMRAQTQKFEFSLLRQNDRLDTMALGNSLYEKAKYLKVAPKASLGFGGSSRIQVESFVNQEFDRDMNQNDTWYLARFKGHMHFKLRNRLEVFAELASSSVYSKTDISPVDRDELWVNQFFVQYQLTKKWSMLVGRENVRLGSGRLIDIREGPNVRLSFDRISLNYKWEDVEMTTFVGAPVQNRPWAFDNDVSVSDELLTGAYATLRMVDAFQADLYLLYKKENDKEWASGVGDDNRLSLGTRLFGNWNRWDYNMEFVYQWGSFGFQDISAWTASLDMDYTLPVGLESQYTIGFKTELISGDRDPEDEKLGTFDALYPRGAYFGRVARFGPSNLIDLHPYLEVAWNGWYAEVDYVAFWRFSTRDAVYGPPLNVQYESLNYAPFIAHQLGTVTGWKANAFTAIELETNIIFPGNFLKESGLDDSLFHMVLTLELNF